MLSILSQAKNVGKIHLKMWKTLVHIFVVSGL